MSHQTHYNKTISRGFKVTALLLLTAVLAQAQTTASGDAGADKDETVKLDPLSVNAERTESKNYRVDQSFTAMKTPTALLDTPQSISIVTEEQIKDQQMLSLGDVVRYVPGITAHQGENNRDQIVFRGNSTSADFFADGVRDDVQYYRDLYNVSRVEVLRGPNAMLFGRGGGGGLINRVMKEAGFAPRREVTLEAGSYDQYRATLDVNQPLNDKFAFRLNALYEDANSFRDGVGLTRSAVNPTVTFAPSKVTSVKVSYEHFQDDRTADRGITSWQGRPADVPIETFYGNPADSHVNADVDVFTATIAHQVGALKIRNHTLFGDYDRLYQNYVPGAVNATQTQVTLSAYNNETKRENLFNQTDLTYVADTGSIHHTLLGGVELGRQKTDNFRNTGYFNNTTTSVSVPYASPTITTPVTFRQSATDADNHLNLDLAAVYIQDQIEFSKMVQAVAGLRFDSFDLEYHNNRTGDTLRRKDNLVSPRAGLILKPAANASLYANYSVSYLPSSGDQFSSLTTITQQVKPEKFRNYELGAKWEINPLFSATVAVYRLDRTNTRSTDPLDPTRIVQTGATRTNGYEIGVTGTVTKQWSITGGYAYQDAYIRSATTSSPAGATVPQVPHHNFSLWNKYQILPNLGIGLGAIYRSDMFAAIDNTVTVPGYTRLDAAIYYAFNNRWRLQANVENLLNKKYYINSDSNTNISPGSPLAVRVMLRTNF